MERFSRSRAEGLELVDALGAVCHVKYIDGIQLDERHPFDDRVRRTFADQDAIVSYCKTALPLGGKPGFASFMHQGVLLDLIKNSSSRRNQNGESAADETREI